MAKETVWIIVFFCLGFGLMFGLKQCGQSSFPEHWIGNMSDPDWQQREMNRSKTILR